METAALGACSGGGGSALVTNPNAPQPHPAQPLAVSASILLSNVGTPTALPSLAGYSETITLPANNAPTGTNLSLTVSTNLPMDTPMVPSNFLLSQPFLYFTLSSPKTVTLQGFPGFSLTLPLGLVWDGGPLHMGYYDPASGWKRVGEPTLTSSTLTFPGNHNPITLLANVKYVVLPFACTVTKIFVTNLGTSTITVYDDQGNQITTTGSFPNLSGPSGIAVGS